MSPDRGLAGRVRRWRGAMGAFPFSRRYVHDRGPGDRTSSAFADHRSGTVPDSHRLRGPHDPVFCWRRVYTAG
jgi:hypothetical protein